MAELQNTSDITNALNAYQSGQPIDEGETPEIVNGYVGAPTYNLYEKVKTGFSPVIQRDYDNQFLEAALSGWGTSRFDKKTGYHSGEDLEDIRANAQPWLGKVTNGIMKMGTTTLSTAVNTVAGTVAGMLSMPIEAVKELSTEGKLSGRDILASGINNPVSNFFVNDFRKFTEELFPNYRTEEERTDEYQRQFLRPSHFFSGNFIGDTLLKNFGFTLGAMGGGMVWSKLAGSVVSKKLASDLMKGAVAAAEGDAEAYAKITEIADIIRKTRSVNGIDWEPVMKNMTDAGKMLKKAQLGTQLLGVTTAALGESSSEGMMARDEFMEEFMPRIQMDFAEAYNSLEFNLFNEHPEWFISTDADGNPLANPILASQEGADELKRRQLELSEKYKKTQEYAEKQANVLSNTTFLLNLPILMTSDLIQFGRMFSGDWTTARRNTPKVKGELGALRSISDGERKFNAVKGSLKVGASEAAEEMLQGFVSSGAKSVAENRLTYFKDLGYDEEATNKAASGMQFFLQGGKDYLGDSKNWQEGVVGALTGLLGIPGKQWHGGVAEAIRTSKAEQEASNKAAETLNKVVNDSKFKERWEDYIRHNKYDEDMKKAVENNDSYAWHIADSEQLVSDVLAFANAGKIEDFKDFADSMANISVDNQDTIDDIKKHFTGIDDETPNAEVIRKVKEQAEKMKTTIDSYYQNFTRLADVAPEDVDTDRFKEMLFTGMQLNAFEDLFFKNLEKTLNTLQPFFAVRAAMNENGEPESDSHKVQMQLETLRNQYAQAISSSASDRSILDKVSGKTISKVLDDTEAELKKISESSSSATEDERKAMEESLQTMRKLASDRRELVKKFRTLRNMSNEEFDSRSNSSEKKRKQAEAQQSQADVSDISSVEDVKVEIAKRTAGKERKDYIDSLRASRENNPNVDEYFKLSELGNEMNSAAKKILNDPSVKILEKNYAEYIIEKMLSKASSTQQIIDMDPAIIPTKEEVIASQSGIASLKGEIGSKAADSLYNSAVNDVRTILNTVQRSQQMMKAFNIDTTEDDIYADESIKEGLGLGTGSSQNPNRRTSQSDEKKAAEALGLKRAEVKAEQQREERLAEAAGVETSLNPDTPTPSSSALQKTQPESTVVSEKEIPDALLEEDTLDLPVDEEPSPISSKPEQTRADIEMNMTDSTVPQNAADGSDNLDNSVDEDGRIDHYNMSVPEKSLTDTRHRIETSNTFSADEYHDLPGWIDEEGVEAGKQYEGIWTILRDKYNAFDNADKVVVGDKVYFFIDPTLEEYKGQPQILMGIKRGDTSYIYNILRTGGKFRGLEELREEVISEYRTWEQKTDGQLFEFSKQSEVWARQAGFIQYDASVDADASINDKPGFDGQAPIISIQVDNDGIHYVQMSGRKINGDIEDVLPQKFKDNMSARGARSSSNIVGNLYYLARGRDKQYIPIRLNVEHFRPESVNAKGYGYDKIHEVANSLAKLTKEFSDNVNKAIASVSSNTYASQSEKNKALASAIDSTKKNAEKEKKKLLKGLGEVLDIHGLSVTFGVFSDPTEGYLPRLRIGLYGGHFDDTGKYVRDVVDRDSIHNFTDSVTEEGIVSYLASLGRSFNVSFPAETLSSKNKVANHVSSMATSGLLTSNAKTMRAEGIDIYINSFNPKTRQFDKEHKIKRSTESEKEPTVSNPAPVNPAIPETTIPPENSTQPAEQNVPGNPEEEVDKFHSLPPDVQQNLLDSGLTIEDINAMDDEMLNELLPCYG